MTASPAKKVAAWEPSPGDPSEPQATRDVPAHRRERAGEVAHNLSRPAPGVEQEAHRHPSSPLTHGTHPRRFTPPCPRLTGRKRLPVYPTRRGRLRSINARVRDGKTLPFPGRHLATPRDFRGRTNMRFCRDFCVRTSVRAPIGRGSFFEDIDRAIRSRFRCYGRLGLRAFLEKSADRYGPCLKRYAACAYDERMTEGVDRLVGPNGEPESSSVFVSTTRTVRLLSIRLQRRDTSMPSFSR